MDLSDKENYLYPSISKNLLKIIYEENIVCFDQKIAFFEHVFFLQKKIQTEQLCVSGTHIVQLETFRVLQNTLFSF